MSLFVKNFSETIDKTKLNKIYTIIHKYIPILILVPSEKSLMIQSANFMDDEESNFLLLGA